MAKCVVTLLSLPDHSAILEHAACGFGWDLIATQNLRTLRALEPGRIAAVLFDREAIGCDWFTAAKSLRACVPESRLIACHHFSEEIDWPTLCDAGVFHAIHLPLSDEELRQSLGYVWALERQRREAEPNGAIRLRSSRAA